MAERSSPTVIVSRMAAADMADEFAAWIARLVGAANRHPGYVDSVVQPPSAGHSDEWTVVYRFVDGPALEGWLHCEQRRDLMVEGEGLVVGDTKEQVLAAAPDEAPARLVSSYRLRDGAESEHQRVQQRLLEVLAAFPGFLELELLDVVDRVQPETVIVLTFESTSALRGWLSSPQRKEILDELDAVTEGELTTNVVGGFAGWFGAATNAEAKKWKQGVAVLIALFPVSLSASWVRLQLWPDLPLAPSVLFANVIGIIALTWFLMPPLTRALDGWLRR